MIITIPGEPQGKGRPRFTKTGRAYTPERTRSYEALIEFCYKLQSNRKLEATKEVHRADGKVIEIPQAYKVEIWAFAGIPKSAPKWKSELMLTHWLKPTKKPDIDNIGKIILDGLNGIAWEDDSVVTELVVHKNYDEKPRVVVEINAI